MSMGERVVADVLDPDRLCGLVDIGVDEISWRKHHRYLTLVSDHDSGTIGWGRPGKDTDILGAFFDELPDGGACLQAVSIVRVAMEVKCRPRGLFHQGHVEQARNAQHALTGWQQSRR